MAPFRCLSIFISKNSKGQYLQIEAGGRGMGEAETGLAFQISGYNWNLNEFDIKFQEFGIGIAPND